MVAERPRDWDDESSSRPLDRCFDQRGTSDALFLTVFPSFGRTSPFAILPFLCSGRCCAWSSQPLDQPQDALKQIAWHRDLRHLESDVPAMGGDLRPDLHQLFPDRGQRPVFHLLGQGQGPHEVGQVVGQRALELSEWFEPRDRRIAIGTMHLAKGLVEFKAVVVMACDEDVLPSNDRVANVADEAELDMVHETERHLFYVACTRARDRLLVTGVEPASEFFEDMADAR